MAYTLKYVPPEKLDNILSKKGDIWSLGCLLYELFSG